MTKSPQRRPQRAPRRPARRALLSIASLVMAVAPMVASTTSPSVDASGTPNINLSESAPATILYGTHASVSLTASNPAGVDWGYNLSYEDVLPAGVSYLPGSTTPATVGDPRILENEPATNQTVLIWSNVSDLSPGSSNTLGFSLSAATDLDPAPYFRPNDSYTDSSSAYVNSDPRYVPQFASNGTGSNYTGSATASGTTSLSPLAISQSPSGAELRGVHDHQFVSTITVKNNDVYATDGIVVTDWLPAGLEYLLCGQTDNTAAAPTNPPTEPGNPDEYPGSGLISGHMSSPANCVTPVSVATEDTDPDGGVELPTAVYTELQWSGLGNLAPSASLTLEFVTAIPIRANTMTWTTGSAPSTTSPFPQAANLDNNSGPETIDGTSLTVYATATGNYTGILGNGSNPVEATGYDTIVARDIITSKTVSDGTFAEGGPVTYTITVSTSEYRVSDDTTVTDTLPSGLCPLGDENYDAHADPQCVPNGDEPSPDYASVAENPDGSFTITWDLGHMDNNATDTITFPAVDRGYYQADDQDTAPTVGNDTLTNTEIAAGNLSVICANGDPDCTGGDTDHISHDTPITVDDVTATASASQSAAGPTINVYVSQNVPAGDTLNCATATYLSSSSPSGYPPTYQKGDMICFQIDVSYPPGTDFKNPVVTDFIPPNSEYLASSETTTASNTAESVGFSAPSGGELQWAMGDAPADPDGNLYESPDTLFETQFAVIATADPPIGNDFQLTQDLAKLVTSNTQGTTFTDRGLVTYQLAAPIVTLTKAVTTVDGAGAPESSGDTVRGGDSVGYTVTVKDTGLVDAYDVEVWDVLPTQDDCADVTAIVPASGACVTGSGGEIIEWPPSAVPDLAPGASTTLTYTMVVPSTAGAGETFSNTAGVRSFLGEDNQGGDNDYYPAADIDPSVTSGEENAPAADQTVDVVSAGAVVTKTAVVTSTNTYASGSDATVGDTITYTVEVTVPHDTTFYHASLADPINANSDNQQTYVSGSGVVTLPDETSFTEAEGSSEGFTYAYDSGTNTVNLTFPTPYPNANSTDEVVEVQFSVTVADVSANQCTDQISNVATLSDQTSKGEPVTASSTPVDTQIVEPDVAISKTVSPARIQPGGISTFTITVTDPTGTDVSTAWDIAGTDTIPTTPAPGLTYVASSLTVSGPATGPAATAGEAAGGVSWSIPELQPGQTVTITYEVNPPPSADMTTGESWTNTGYLTSWCAVNGCATLPATRTYGSIHSAVALPAEYPTLQVTKSAPNGSTALDDTAFSWKVVVKNTATVAIAKSLAVTDTLPPNWAYDPGSSTIVPPTGPDSYTDPTVSVNAGGDVLTWTGLGTLNPGKSLTITYTATPEVSPLTTSNTGPSYAYPNAAFATATDNTGSAGNGSVVQYTSTTSTADAYIGDAVLQITKTHSGNFSAGADGTYSLAVTNHGPSAAGTPVTVTDPIVSPETYVSAGGSNASYEWGCSYSATTLTVTCILETTGGSATALPNGTTAPTISVVVDTPSSTTNGTVVTNTATAASPTWDSNPAEETSSNPTTIVANAALAITKSHTGSFTAGSQGTYTISVVNNGPSDAQGTLTVTDHLPSGESLVSATGSDWTCGTPSGGVFTCTDPNNLASGSYAPPITEVVDVAAAQAPGSITNSASVTSPTNNPDPSGATSNNPTTVVTSADLALTKLHVGTFVAGEGGTYDFTVTNSTGPSNAAGPLTVTDTLPSGETFVSGGGGATGWTCSVSSGTVTCTDPSALDVGASTSFTMAVAIGSGVTVSTLTNTATLSSPTTDPVPASETSTDNAGTVQSADLQVVKTLTGPLVAGDQATYSLAVSDAGPSNAEGDSQNPIVITDTLPTGETYVSFAGTGWTCTAADQAVTCDYPASIAAGAPASVITLTVALASDLQPTSLTNTATGHSTTPDPDTSDETSAITDTSSTSADLSITKTDNGPFTAGDDGEYYIVVHNAGPSAALGDLAQPVVVTDTLPSGETYVSATGTGWTCTADDQVVTCDDTSSIVAGTSAATIDLVVAVSPSLHAASVTNDASVSSPTSNPDPGNASTTDTTSIQTSADLSITKTHSGALLAGSDLTYSLVVTNHGPSDAILPAVIDDVPSPLVLVSAEGGGAWDCNATVGNDVSCTGVANLPAGGTAATISVEVSVPSSQAATMVTNTAGVSSTTSDPDQANNTSSDPTTIATSADLTVTKVHQGTFTAGTDGSYLITVDNLGPSDAAEPVTVTDTLPTTETFVAGTGTGWSCSAVLQVVTCTDAANLASGQSADRITLSVAIASSATGSVENTVAVSSATPEPQPDDNTGSDTAPLALSADLSITKSHVGDFTAGLDGTYSIGVHDAGPSDSGTGVVVSDTLPTGETFVSAEGTGWTCVAVGPTVTCTLATPIMVAGDAPSLSLTVAVKSGAVGTLTNVALVEGPNPDPALDNNTASDPTTSDRMSDLSLLKTLLTPLEERGDATYALAVTNAGPSDSASPVTLTDPLPAGLTYVSSSAGSAGAWSCAAAGQTVTCTDSAPVVASTTSTFDIKVAVGVAEGSEITNTATVQAAGDVDAADEIGSVEGIVAAAAPVPDSGAAASGGSPWLPGTLLLLIGGLALAVGSRRRLRHLLRRGRAG